MAFTLQHDPFNDRMTLNGMTLKKNSLSNIFSSQVEEDQMLNPGVRYTWGIPSSGSMYALYEEAPKRRTIEFRHTLISNVTNEDGDIIDRHSSYEFETYEVITPWVYYVLSSTVDTVFINSIFFAKESINNFDSPVFFPCIPNVYFHELTPGRVCNGNVVTPKDVPENAVNWAKSIPAVMSDFWSSAFNTDIMAFQEFNPFNFMTTIAEDSLKIWDEDAGTYADVHAGMTAWSLLDEQQVLDLPYHYLFPLSKALENADGNYAMNRSIQSSQSVSHYDRIKNNFARYGFYDQEIASAQRRLPAIDRLAQDITYQNRAQVQINLNVDPPDLTYDTSNVTVNWAEARATGDAIRARPQVDNGWFVQHDDDETAEVFDTAVDAPEEDDDESYLL